MTSKEDFELLRMKVDQTCEKLSVRANLIKLDKQENSEIQPSVLTDIFKIQLTDLQPAKKAYLLLRYPKKTPMKLQEGASYLIDKIKLVLNKKGELILISTSLTVMIEYALFKADDEDSMSVGSFEGADDAREEYYYADGQNKRAVKDDAQLHYEQMMKDNELREQDEYNLTRNESMGIMPKTNSRGDWAGQARATIHDLFPDIPFQG